MQSTDDKVRHLIQVVRYNTDADGHRSNNTDADHELMELENENMKLQNEDMPLQLQIMLKEMEIQRLELEKERMALHLKYNEMCLWAHAISVVIVASSFTAWVHAISSTPIQCINEITSISFAN